MHHSSSPISPFLGLTPPRLKGESLLAMAFLVLGLASILQATPEVALVYPLAQSFRRLIAHGDPAGVLSWIEEAGASAAPEVRRFAQGLRHDLDAVLAAFRLRSGCDGAKVRSKGR